MLQRSTVLSENVLRIAHHTLIAVILGEESCKCLLMLARDRCKAKTQLMFK